MALLQSLRQSEAPPAEALAAVVPPPQLEESGSSGGGAQTASGRSGSGSAAAGSSGAMLLQQLQGMSVAQRPAPAASELHRAPSAADKSTTGSTSDVQVC